MNWYLCIKRKYRRVRLLTCSYWNHYDVFGFLVNRNEEMVNAMHVIILITVNGYR